MKILFVIDEFPKLSETFILDQIAAFIEHGDEVNILSLHASGEIKVNEKVTQHNLLDKTFFYLVRVPMNEFYKLAWSSYLRLFISSPASALKSLNFVRYGKTIKSLRHLFAIERLKQISEHNDYNAIICHYGPNGNLAAILKDFKVLNGKLVTFFHGYDMTSYMKWHGTDCYDFLFKTGDLLLPISDFWRNKLIKLGCNPSKIVTHHMGVDPALFDFNPGPINSAVIKLLSVARLVEKKGIRYAIEAVDVLVKRGLNIQYKIIGGGPLFDELKQLVQDLKLENSIMLGKEASHEEVVHELKNTDLFLLPSVTSSDGDMEGIPVALMEAMAVGKIVVSTNHSGIPELIEQRVTGFLAEEKDPEGLADIISEILKMNPEDLLKIQKNARQKVESDFNAKILNKQLIDLIQ